MKKFFDEIIAPLADRLTDQLAKEEKRRADRIHVMYFPTEDSVWVKSFTGCTGFGSHKCHTDGGHSWFNHSMDSYHTAPMEDNYPPNFNEDI